jgi:hypothetical protein
LARSPVFEVTHLLPIAAVLPAQLGAGAGEIVGAEVLDPAAKRVVADLLNQFGLDVVDAGPLAEGRCFQKRTPAYCVPFNAKDCVWCWPEPVETITRT